ncbi:MAG: phosphoribosylformylglycinamidine synthase subunit PurQ [Phycisphaerales bacterium]|nr:phosphoribosylformylglycinamidine synthase subunit PurQ [Phycisphaerales bacterium]
MSSRTETSDPKPRALLLRAAGTNCDDEMVRAFALAGAEPKRVHLERLIEYPRLLEEFDIIGIPGGFSYGDDIAAGRVLAVRMRTHLYGALCEAAARGVPIIGVCNGFQALVQCGLLPGPEPIELDREHRARSTWPAKPPPSVVTLAHNSTGRFIDTWVRVKANAASPCVWTRALLDMPDVARMLPLASGEGRFVTTSQRVLDVLEAGGQVALRYIDNVNGSEGSIAGVCDASGRIFGLMPHPDRYLSWDHHPFATRLDASVRQAEAPGVTMFRGAVDVARELARAR